MPTSIEFIAVTMSRYAARFMLLAMLWSAAAHAETTIGIRFIVSDELGRDVAQQQRTRAALEEYVTEINGYYKNSDILLRADVVDIAFSRISERSDVEILRDMARERNGFDNMFQLANEYGADYSIAVMKSLIVQGKRGCGRAFRINKTIEEISSTRNAFAVVNFVCGAHTIAHELGHLMGLNHGVMVGTCQQDKWHTNAIVPYANGFAVGNCDGKPQPGEFGTIMVGGWMRDINGNDKSSLRIFSNPRIHDERCGADKTCGDPEIGDAARALNENARYYAAHEEPDVHTLRYASAELLACIKQKYRGKEIVELEELICPNAGISSLAGVERLTALRRIDLSGNRLEDVGPLGELPAERVERIDLRENSRISCASLDRLVDRIAAKVARPASCLPR